ncbi:MAG: membrane protein [Cyclobacteriaceae bacterium]|nr:MAG: membrane protein [Cyclobacteriaceae bacterium]
MPNFQRLNTYAGWIIFAIATLVYILTVEETASFWDCGEFIASSYKLQVPHPPGAPFFLLTGRIFSFLAFGDTSEVAFWINQISVLSSGFTILFLFWSISLLGRKLFKINEQEISMPQTLTIIGGSAIGALAYTFSDSFWFSAGEAEVYAMSSFFTAFVFWAILKWERVEDESKANRWLILIAYMMGLSIGVHLLNLVTIPALAMIYYYKKYKPSTMGFIATMTISLLIILTIMSGIIPGLPSLAGAFEIFFVNNLGLPFGSGIIAIVVILLGGLLYGIYKTQRQNRQILNTALLSLAFVLIGYSSYTLIVIRSNYNPPIDQNNPDDIMSIVSYLKREQYGYRPLMHGRYFTAQLTDQKKGKPVYVKGKDKYEIAQYRIENIYDPTQTTILPRIYSGDNNHVARYQEVLGLKDGEIPSFVDNIAFLLKHQLGHMYFRYFLWNFAGRESDVQDADWLAPWDTKSDLPERYAGNKARNNYLMLPLILGIVGMFFQYNRHEKGFWVVLLLFFLTGIALILYLNSPPIEPRERDYIYVGSFYAFAIWIGFGTMALADWLKKYLTGIKAPAVATAVSVLIPVVMAAEGWNDHDRSNRYFSVDSAINYLESCAPNAILFTGGDNDTFPLWYAQEVEGVRTDVRVIVLTYFATDWYIDQMRRPTYESQPLPLSLSPKNYKQGGANDYLLVREDPRLKGQAVDLKQYLKLIRNESDLLRLPTSFGDSVSVMPAKRIVLGVDSAEVINKGIIPKGMENLVTNQMIIPIKGGALYKNDLALLDILATNNWERPVYFNQTSLMNVNLNLRDYVVQEGATFRLLPVDSKKQKIANSSLDTELDFNAVQNLVNSEVMFQNVMEKFRWRELDNPNTYYTTEDYKDKAVSVHRSYLNNLAATLIQENKIDKARDVLLKSLKEMPDKSIPYGIYNAEMVKLLFQVDESEKALEIAGVLSRRADEELAYLTRKGTTTRDTYINLRILDILRNTMKSMGQTEEAQRLEEIFLQHYSLFQSQ